MARSGPGPRPIATSLSREAVGRGPSRGILPVVARVAGERKIELTWRCSSCEHRNLGRHAICLRCGDPKDASERYELPPADARAATVTDPALLRLASAGANWRCAYCGSDQRRLDRACARCGAPSDAGADLTPAAPVRSRVRRTPPRRGLVAALVVLAGAVRLAVLGTVALLTLGWWASRPFEATVTALRWEHVVEVERYAIRAEEGFAESRPSDAFDVEPRGDRHHHDEQVLDHYTTETYTEQVACGQDCTRTPETCSESCTSDENGFATCRTVCSGGGQRCSTRYCSETRTRQVPVYRTEPRYATWYAWRRWAWAPERTLRRAGVGHALDWPPPEEIALGLHLGEGEREREMRRTSYTVTVRDDDGVHYTLRPPTTGAYLAYAVGRRLRVARTGREPSEVEEVDARGEPVHKAAAR